jgi:hypothetical protein
LHFRDLSLSALSHRKELGKQLISMERDYYQSFERIVEVLLTYQQHRERVTYSTLADGFMSFTGRVEVETKERPIAATVE